MNAVQIDKTWNSGLRFTYCESRSALLQVLDIRRLNSLVVESRRIPPVICYLVWRRAQFSVDYRKRKERIWSRDWSMIFAVV
jgi:hypothetical protein